MGNQFSNGITGAVSLALIAFTTVFLVLGGLTLIIYCVKYIAALGGGLGKGEGNQGKQASSPAGRAAGAGARAASAPPVAIKGKGEEEGRLAAVISAALAAALGRGVKIKKISKAAPAAGEGSRLSGWKAGILLSAGQGMVKDPWTRRK